MDTLITDIQRFSLNDGDGIRTTVFFKGCNMNCSWCHNPETISLKRELMFYETKCIGCGKCFKICPNHAHVLKDKNHYIDRTLCTGCGNCADVCYAEALTMCGKKMSLEEVMRQIRQDVEYYKNSNGGVTLSGGEVLCNKPFAIALADACHLENIHVAVESNISLPFDNISDLLKKVDLIMCDIKIFNDDEHKKYTGISNKHIMNNIKEIDKLDIPVIVRTPLIPGVTDSENNLSSIAEYIKDMKNLQRYELLNFNPLGAEKYKGLQQKNEFVSVRPLTDEKLNVLLESVKKHGVCVKVV